MNNYQEQWWRQSRSDHDVFLLLRSKGAAPCHLLHYLQMATEKISKAYYWRSGNAPPRSHAGFMKFMRFLGGVRKHERQHIASVFGFPRFKDFQAWACSASPLVYDLQRLAPTLAGDSENPEYPWPHAAPEFCPATHDFEIWRQLINTGRGRQLMNVIARAIERFPDYG